MTAILGSTGIQCNQPSNGTAFHTSGNYGSTIFDSFDGARLDIAICDDCLRPRMDRTRVIETTQTVRRYNT